MTEPYAKLEALKALEVRFEKHMNEHRLDEQEYIKRQLEQDAAYIKNMDAIAKLTEATQGVVNAWQAASALQRFIKWLSGFAFLGVMIAWATGSNPFK